MRCGSVKLNVWRRSTTEPHKHQHASNRRVRSLLTTKWTTNMITWSTLQEMGLCLHNRQELLISSETESVLWTSFGLRKRRAKLWWSQLLLGFSAMFAFKNIMVIVRVNPCKGLRSFFFSAECVSVCLQKPLSTWPMHLSVSHHPLLQPTYQFTQITKSRPSYLLSKS